MKKEDLLKSAGFLKMPSKETVKEYEDNKDILLEIINKRMLSVGDIEKLVGENNISMMKNNHENHVKFISSIIQNYDPNVLVETVLWVFRTYMSRGFSINYWYEHLNSWILILKENLTAEAYNEIFPFYEWMLENIPVFAEISSQKYKQV